jgi:hypothetical protein
LAVGFPSAFLFLANRLTAEAAHAGRRRELVPHLANEQQLGLYLACSAFSKVLRSQSKLTVAGTV